MQNVKEVIQAAKERGDAYSQKYIQYVVIPGIIDKMSFTDKKMTTQSLNLKKGQKHISGS